MCQHCEGYLVNCPICRDEPEKEVCEYCEGKGYTLIDGCGKEADPEMEEGDDKFCLGCDCTIDREVCEKCEGTGFKY